MSNKYHIREMISKFYVHPDKKCFVKQNYLAFELYILNMSLEILAIYELCMQMFNLKGLNQSKYEMLVSKTKE